MPLAARIGSALFAPDKSPGLANGFTQPEEYCNFFTVVLNALGSFLA